jgi:hypothetical protein
MMVLDTNVLSELTRTAPDPRVLSLLDAVPAERCCLTAITLAEIRAGVEAMPAGRKRVLTEEAWEIVLQTPLAREILPFDTRAALAYGALVAQRRAAGRTLQVQDGQILAIALARGAAIVTRDREGFRDSGVDIFDPWADNPPTTP